MDELKEEFQKSTDPQRRLRILTLSHFSVGKNAVFFGTTWYMVRRSFQLKAEKGILPEIPPYSKGRKISEEECQKVKSFYESDEVSRICPGKKDYVTVRDENGVKVKKQKRLILGNLQEIYQLYKENGSNPRIGFSKFASLRPKHCVLLGSNGTHTVCVCCYHQNVKLMLASLGLKDITYKDLLKHAVCDVGREACMLQKCENCPGQDGVRSYLIDTLNAQAGEISDLVDEVRFSQWLSTDRCTLTEIVLPMDEFLDKLSDAIVTLTRHHFTSQHQSKYFDDLKKQLPEHEALIILYFSENYTFVVQDKIQSYHWNAPQCTVHPFVVYWREAGKIECHSFCVLSNELKHDTVAVHTSCSALYRK